MTATTTAPELKEKTCTVCKESWPADREFFGFDRYSSDRLTHTCSACLNGSQSSHAAYGAQTKELSSLLAAFTQKPNHTTPTHN